MTQDPNMPGSTPPGDVPPGGMPPAGGMPQEMAGGGFAGPPPTKEEQTMAMLAHLLGIIGFLGPLIIWLIKKDTSPFLNDQGKEALNFHLTMLIGFIIGIVLTFACIGVFVILAVWVVSLIFSIIAALKANQGIPYRYPFSIRMIK